jgi:hypothetical protein
MDSYGAYIIATARQEDYAREAATERPVRQARRDRERAAPDATPLARRHHGSPRPAIA